MFTVAVDTGPLYGPITGVGRAVSGILDEYRRRQTEIHVIPYVVSRRARLQPGTRRLPYPASLALMAWSRSEHPRADLHVRPADIIHGMNYVVPPARCPRVVSVYDTWALRHPEQCSAVVNRAMNVLERNIRTGAVVHTSSHATAQDVGEIFPRAIIHVAHLGAPPFAAPEMNGSHAPVNHDISLIVQSKVPYILTIGTIERRKNLPRFIEAFAAYASTHRDVNLVIAGGPGNDSDAVRSTIDRLDSTLASRIVLLGRVCDHSRDVLYANAQLVAYPSLDEGFGFPILEAMAHGVPVLAADTGSIPEISGDAAVLVDPLDIDAMSGAIDRLMADDVFRRSLTERGRDRCAQFTWEKTADSLIELYRSLIERRDT